MPIKWLGIILLNYQEIKRLTAHRARPIAHFSTPRIRRNESRPDLRTEIISLLSICWRLADYCNLTTYKNSYIHTFHTLYVLPRSYNRNANSQGYSPLGLSDHASILTRIFLTSNGIDILNITTRSPDSHACDFDGNKRYAKLGAL